MMRNSLWNRDLFDGFMSDMFDDDFFGAKNPLYGKHAKNMMKTDIRETEDGYELDIDLPGFKKDEIQAELKNGYLTVSAAKGLDKDEENKKGEYIRRERYAGSMSRSFYVGEHLDQQDIKAKYEDGILKLSIRRKNVKETGAEQIHCNRRVIATPRNTTSKKKRRMRPLFLYYLDFFTPPSGTPHTRRLPSRILRRQKPSTPPFAPKTRLRRNAAGMMITR